MTRIGLGVAGVMLLGVALLAVAVLAGSTHAQEISGVTIDSSQFIVSTRDAAGKMGHVNTQTVCAIYVGATPVAPATKEGVPTCR